MVHAVRASPAERHTKISNRVPLRPSGVCQAQQWLCSTHPAPHMQAWHVSGSIIQRATGLAAPSPPTCEQPNKAAGKENIQQHHVQAKQLPGVLAAAPATAPLLKPQYVCLHPPDTAAPTWGVLHVGSLPPTVAALPPFHARRFPCHTHATALLLLLTARAAGMWPTPTASPPAAPAGGSVERTCRDVNSLAA